MTRPMTETRVMMEVLSQWTVGNITVTMPAVRPGYQSCHGVCDQVISVTDLLPGNDRVEDDGHLPPAVQTRLFMTLTNSDMFAW